jgi:hypothetical protein
MTTTTTTPADEGLAASVAIDDALIIGAIVVTGIRANGGQVWLDCDEQVRLLNSDRLR